ncbi:MAG: hypothetical protein GY810_26585 [Aureispira sp.]|nr:hypothetical protein [Aureispira sp.]
MQNFNILFCFLLALQATTLSAQMNDEECKKALEEANKTRLYAQEAIRHCKINAEEAKMHLEKARYELAKSRHELVKAKRFQILMRAQAIAAKSNYMMEASAKGFLAQIAYQLHNKANGTPYSAYIYEPLIKTLSLLQIENKNPDFNMLPHMPLGVRRLGRIRGLAITTIGEYCYSIEEGGHLLKHKIRQYNTPKERNEKQNLPEILSKKNYAIHSLALSPQKNILAYANDRGLLNFYDLEKNEVFLTITSHNQKRIWDFEFATNGDAVILATEENDKSTSINYNSFDGKKTTLVAKTEIPIKTIARSADGHYIAGIGASPKICIWDSKTGEQIYTLEDIDYPQSPTALAFDPLGRFLAVGYQDGALMIWDLEEAQLDKIPERRYLHKASISSLAFDQQGQRLIAGSLDKSATIWTIRLKKLDTIEYPFLHPEFLPIRLPKHDNWITAVAFNSLGSKAYTGCSDGSIRFWETHPDTYAKQLCKFLSIDMTKNIWERFIGTDDPEKLELYINTPDGKLTPENCCN